MSQPQYTRNTLAFIDVFREDVGCIGITDHNYYDDCLIDAFMSLNNNSLIKFISGVEINSNGIHILCFFGNKLYNKQTYSEGIKNFLVFLVKLGVNSQKDGYGGLNLSAKQPSDVLNLVKDLDGICIFPHCNSDNGLFQERTKTDRTFLSNIFNHNDYIILQANNKSSIDKTFEYINIRTNQLISTPIPTIASDGRKMSDFANSDSDGNYCWIKADPTFEGLKQIIHEPDERVRLQEQNPEFEYQKPHFSSIEIEKKFNIYEDENESLKFETINLPLNKNLITIIGGRGEGKSTLINYLANIHSEFDANDDEQKYNFSLNSNFKYKYHKLNTKDLEEEDRFLFNWRGNRKRD